METTPAVNRAECRAPSTAHTMETQTTVGAPPRQQRRGTKESPSPSKSTPDSVVNKHLAHIRTHLARIREGHANVHDPDNMFLGEDQVDHFWELIGICIRGHASPILGAVRFRRHDFPGEAYARESLASYLSAPGARTAGGMISGQAGLPVLLPRASDEIPDFLRSLRGGRAPRPISLDPSSIEVAFDFRMHNPFVLNALRKSSDPLKRRFLRTTRGHVLTGLSHDPLDPHAVGEFLAIKDPVQHTPKGKLSLPHLAVNRSFISLSADASEAATRLAAPHWVPFAPSLGHSRHLLTS